VKQTPPSPAIATLQTQSYNAHASEVICHCHGNTKFQQSKRMRCNTGSSLSAMKNDVTAFIVTRIWIVLSSCTINNKFEWSYYCTNTVYIHVFPNIVRPRTLVSKLVTIVCHKPRTREEITGEEDKLHNQELQNLYWLSCTAWLSTNAVDLYSGGHRIESQPKIGYHDRGFS
jgi:hypothetical protein